MPVKLHASVNPRRVDEILAAVDYVSSVPFSTKVFNFSKIKADLLRELRSHFPIAEGTNRRDDRKFRPHLFSGFRTYEIPGLAGKVGFVLKHASINDLSIRRILLALEKGSRAWKLPVPEGGIFAFLPGDKRGDRHPGPDDYGDLATGIEPLKIPARKGLGYMRKTLAYARELVMRAKPEYFRKVKEEFTRRTKGR